MGILHSATASAGHVPIFEPEPPLVVPPNWTFKDSGIAAGFERHVREQLPWYTLATGAVAHVARHYVPDHGLIYDLGASTGNIGIALEATIDARGATLVSVEASAEMAARYRGPQRGNLLHADICDVRFRPFDLAVSFLTMMFVPVASRDHLMDKLRAARKPGGAIVVFDKCEAERGYAATVIWRLALAGKVAAGVLAEDIVAKELSLGGVQRPVTADLFGADAIEFFRFGEFAGWLIA
jgi:tRNA (cmo5U34)-methyltransferase